MSELRKYREFLNKARCELIHSIGDYVSANHITWANEVSLTMLKRWRNGKRGRAVYRGVLPKLYALPDGRRKAK